jgi:hypothetical protein
MATSRTPRDVNHNPISAKSTKLAREHGYELRFEPAKDESEDASVILVKDGKDSVLDVQVGPFGRYYCASRDNGDTSTTIWMQRTSFLAALADAFAMVSV